MAVKPSGSLSMKTDIVGEFGGAAPHGLKEYYDAATGIPASGTISMSDFYGKSSLFTLPSRLTKRIGIYALLL